MIYFYQSVFYAEKPSDIGERVSGNSGSTDGTGSDKAGREKIYAAFPQIDRK